MKKLYSLHLLFQIPVTTVIGGLIGFLSIPFLLKPQNVPLLGSRVFAGVVKLRWGHTGFWWALKPAMDTLIRRECHRDTVKTTWRQRQGLEWSGYKPKNAKTCWSHEKLKTKKDRFSPEASKKTRLCHHLDFRLLPSSTARIKFCCFKLHSLWPFTIVQFSSLSHVRLLATPWITTRQASLSLSNSWSLPKPMSIELVMPSNHLILCCPLLLLPSIFPSIRVFSNESALHIRWPNIGVSASTSVLPMNTQDWFPLGWIGWISLQSKGLSRIFSNTTVQKHQFFGTQLSL